jgi:hypothetical protein
MRTLAIKGAWIILACSAASVLAGEPIWLETEQFDQSGGWTADAQFIDQMGSTYLMAIGLGQPVGDALTTLRPPRAARYRLWARTKDWAPKHHPGRFQIVLDGRPPDHVFGESGLSGWCWEDGGVHQLSDEVQVQLHDLTGYYARCDAILLTDDLSWTPPEEQEAVDRLRAQLGGASRNVVQMPERDVIVVGGGLAGCTAAVAAARNGASTVLIQNRPILGGNASTEILVPPVGVWPGVYRERYPLDPRETGLMEEYRTAGNQRVSEGKLYSKRLLRFVELEPNLDLYLNTHATGVEMVPPADATSDAGRRIAAVLAVDTKTGRRMRFPGKIFLDSSGDAVVGAAAGAEFRHGKEPKSMYGEPWAPETASQQTMGSGLKYFPQDTGSPQPFEAPPWIYRFPRCQDFGPERHPPLPQTSAIGYQWKFELGGLRDTYADAEEIRDDLLRLIYGLWDHTKNHCDDSREKAATYKLAWVGYVAGKRENRRLIGDYVLTQNDIGSQTLFDDRVAFGGWSVDDHYSAGFFHDGPTGRHLDHPEHHYRGVPFSIPFRCLYSKNVDNLLMAGRDISASHLALADTRVMLTCAVIGHAAGAGAAICIENTATPRVICQHHIGELQQRLLKEGAHIIHLEADDPRDLAPRARVTASSEQTRIGGEVMAAEKIVNGYARAVGEGIGAETNAWGADPHAPGPHWVELAWPEPVALNVVHVTFQTAELAPKSFAVEAWQQGQWTRVAEVSDNRHRRHVLGLDRITASKLRVTLDEPAGICEIRVYDEPQRLVEIARRAHHNMRLPDRGPWLPWTETDQFENLDGLVIDSSQAIATGAWTHSTWSDRFILDGYLHDGDTGKGAKSLRFVPQLAAAGKYEVRIAYVAYGNRATNTPITIHTRTGAKTIRINQRAEPPIDGLFLSLGRFDLAPQTAAVEIRNDQTDGYVVVDAVQFIP